MQQSAHNTNPADTSASDHGAATLAHLSAPIAFVISAGALPFLGPLVIWFLYKDKSVFVRRAAAGAFNFNISVAIFVYVLGAVAFLSFITFVLIPVALIAVAAIVAVGIAQFILHILAAVASQRGEQYRYPFALPVLS